MTSIEIWSVLNKEVETVAHFFRGMQDSVPTRRTVVCNTLYRRLEQMMPCLFGVDEEKNALIFRSEDEGTVAAFVTFDDEGNVGLAMETDVELE